MEFISQGSIVFWTQNWTLYCISKWDWKAWLLNKQTNLSFYDTLVQTPEGVFYTIQEICTIFKAKQTVQLCNCTNTFLTGTVKSGLSVSLLKNLPICHCPAIYFYFIYIYYAIIPICWCTIDRKTRQQRDLDTIPG